MRLSIYDRSGFTVPVVSILVNGKPVSGVLVADEERGYVVAYKQLDGRPIVWLAGIAKKERICGKVEIIIADTANQRKG